MRKSRAPKRQKREAAKAQGAKRARDGYLPEYALIAARLTLLGYSIEDLVKHFGTCKSSFYNWLERYPEFQQAVRKNGALGDGEVAASLRDRAIGYSHPEEKIFCTQEGKIVRAKTTKHYPPSEVAAMMWLSNRQPEYWKHRNTMDLTNSDGSFKAFAQALRGQGKTLEGRYRIIEPASIANAKPA